MTTIDDAPRVESGTAVALQARGVHRSYVRRDRTGKRTEVLALKGVDVAVARGGSLAIVGESGSGKSTLARVLVGLEAPDKGTIMLDGVDFYATRGPARRRMHSKIQMIFQDPYRSLNPRMSIRNSLKFAYEAGPRTIPFEEECERMFGLVRLPLAHLDRRPGLLSGGERQRVSIARALMVRPDVVVADEAVSALDRSVQADVLNLLGDLRSDLGLTLVYITHDMHTVPAVCDDVTVLKSGLVVESGNARQIMADPREEYTKALVAAAPTVERALERRHLRPGQVAMPALGDGVVRSA